MHCCENVFTGKIKPLLIPPKAQVLLIKYYKWSFLKVNFTTDPRKPSQMRFPVFVLYIRRSTVPAGNAWGRRAFHLESSTRRSQNLLQKTGEILCDTRASPCEIDTTIGVQIDAICRRQGRVLSYFVLAPPNVCRLVQQDNVLRPRSLVGGALPQQ